jgi:hypothetical protein
MVGHGIKHGMMSAVPAPKPGPLAPAPSAPTTMPARQMPESMAIPIQHGSPPWPMPAHVVAGVLLGTTAAFIGAIWATSWFVPLKFT